MADIDLDIPGLAEVTEIGRGGFATVYSALEVDAGRYVAVKVLDAVDDSGRRRFDRERRTMGQTTDHTNIVTMFRSGYTTIGNRPFLVMEYMAGGSLRDQLDRGQPLPWPDAIKIVAIIADALAFAHEAGIVHRDVKPANILVSSTGVVKLGDFGIAAIHDSTATSQVALSPSYAPPEAFSAGRGPSGEALDPRDERSDLYSLAATLYTLGTGRPPFDAVNPAALMNQILTELPHPVGHEQLDQFFAVAMAKNPAHRPQTARRLIEFLAPLRGDAATGATALAGPPPPPHGIGSPAATTVSLPEVSEPTMGGHKPIDDHHRTEPRPSGGPERERRGGVVVALVALAAISAVSAGLIALWQSNRDTNTGLATVESGSVDSDAEEPSDDAGATDADQPTDEEPTDDQPTDEEPTDEEPTEPSDDGEASQHYVGVHYELDVPAEWVLTFQDDDRGYGFRTQWKGPDGSILLIDTSPNPGGVSAEESATEQYVNNINTATRGVEQESADPDVWGFELQRSDGLRLALYLFDGANGYGIVGTHPTDPALAHAAARQAAQTIQSRSPVILNS